MNSNWALRSVRLRTVVTSCHDKTSIDKENVGWRIKSVKYMWTMRIGIYNKSTDTVQFNRTATMWLPSTNRGTRSGYIIPQISSVTEMWGSVPSQSHIVKLLPPVNCRETWGQRERFSKSCSFPISKVAYSQPLYPVWFGYYNAHDTVPRTTSHTARVEKCWDPSMRWMSSKGELYCGACVMTESSVTDLHSEAVLLRGSSVSPGCRLNDHPVSYSVRILFWCVDWYYIFPSRPLSLRGSSFFVNQLAPRGVTPSPSSGCLGVYNVVQRVHQHSPNVDWAIV